MYGAPDPFFGPKLETLSKSRITSPLNCKLKAVRTGFTELYTTLLTPLSSVADPDVKNGNPDPTFGEKKYCSESNHEKITDSRSGSNLW